MIGWVVLAALAAAALIAVVALVRRANARQLLLMERMRTSVTYHYVRPLFEACRGQRIERISLRPEAVLITFFSPVGKKYQCIFDHYGLDPIEAEPLSALAQLAAVEIPELADNHRYFFKRHRDHLDNGSVLVWYEYMVQSRYKDSVLRASYDRMQQ